MTGVIERIAHDASCERTTEIARKNVEAREAAARDVAAERERRAAARKLAMRAAKGMTGRVIFPARWRVEPGAGYLTTRCVETIEGRVTIEILVHGRNVEYVTVYRPGDRGKPGAFCQWKQPQRRDVPPNRWPVGPGPRWFRETLAKLEVI